MMPVKLSKMMNVKNLRYVLNHRSANIHRGTFVFVGVGFFGTSVLSAVAFMDSRLTAGLAAGQESDRSGLLGFGVMPECTCERTVNCVLFRLSISGLEYESPGTVCCAELSCMPFSAASTAS
jgi:hypothetical protein